MHDSPLLFASEHRHDTAPGVHVRFQKWNAPMSVRACRRPCHRAHREVDRLCPGPRAVLASSAMSAVEVGVRIVRALARVRRPRPVREVDIRCECRPLARIASSKLRNGTSHVSAAPILRLAWECSAR